MSPPPPLAPPPAVSVASRSFVHNYSGVPIQTKTSGLAIASLILGILWLGGVGAVLALIFGIAGKSRINHSEGQQGGQGLANAGIILGIIGIVGAVLLYAGIALAAHGVNQFSTSYNDGHNYGASQYSPGGDSSTVCNNAPIPAGDDTAEFDLGCEAGWASASNSSNASNFG